MYVEAFVDCVSDRDKDNSQGVSPKKWKIYFYKLFSRKIEDQFEGFRKILNVSTFKNL